MCIRDRDYLETEYGDVDCSISFYNIGVIVLALLYGNGDFEKTITPVSYTHLFDSFWPGSCNTVVDKGLTAILSGSGDIDQIISDMDSAYQEDKDSVIRPLLVY